MSARKTVLAKSKHGRRKLERRRLCPLERLEPRLLLTATARDGIPYIDLGPSDNVAWDQPRVTVELLTDAAGTGSVGPQVFNSMLLDTGANTSIMMATAIREMSDPPYPYQVEGKFEEVGVAGTQLFDISASYRFDFAGKNGVRNTLLDSRIISDPDNDFSQFGPWGVIGMPTMVDRVTTLDYSVWETVQGLDLFMGVEFEEEVPASNGHRYTIDVDNRLEFEPEPYVISGCCPPMWGDVPFLTAYTMHNGVAAGGNFLFDTGAQVSVLSTSLGFQLGLDSNDDGVLDENDANFARFETVGGIGGATSVPVFLFDEVHVPTQSGIDLVWTDLQWLVIDIVPGLDGVFGSDLMTSGWLEGFAVAGKSGWIDQIQLDFRQMNVDGTSEVHFDLNEQVHQIIDPNGAGAQIIENGSHTTVSEIGLADQYQIVLTQQPTADVTITLSNPDGDLAAVDAANLGNSFLTFTPSNWDTPQTVHVTAIDDLIEEAFHRGSVVHISSSADPAYQAVGMPRVIVNIFDDEFGGVVAIPTEGETNVTEGGAGDTYDLVLTLAPTQDVTISLGTVGNQVTAVDDNQPSNNYLVFTPSNWDVPQSVRVTAVDDSLAEGIHEAYINHSIVTEATEYQDAFALQEFVEITDNDAGGIVIDPTDGLTTTEASGQATFTVSLQTPPTADVEIGLSSSDATEGTVFPTKVVFTTTNWTTPQVVTVTGVNDDLVDGDIEYTIVTAPAISTDPVFSGRPVDDITVVNVDDDVDGLSVTALIPTNTGFVALFNNDVDVDVLNIYDTQSSSHGPTDVVLQGQSTGPVSGNLTVDPSLRTLTFVKTGGTLAPDSYTVTLRSGNDGFRTTSGALLDGDGNGATGDDFVATFPVAAAAPNAVTVGLPDFVRGPGQTVNLPADTSDGIPLSLSDGSGVRSVSLQISYNAALLEITAATVAAGMPEGSTVSLNRPIPGFAIITFTSPTDLPAGGQTFVNLRAQVPTANANENYGAANLLDVQGITVLDSGGTPLPVIDDDGVQVAAYFGDASGNGRVNASDAALVARVAALLDSGFSSSPVTDPVIMGDISGNERLNAADASLVAQVAALLPVAEIPPVPAGIVTNAGGNTAAAKPAPAADEGGPLARTALPARQTATRGLLPSYRAWDRLPIDRFLENYSAEESTEVAPLPTSDSSSGDVSLVWAVRNNDTVIRRPDTPTVVSADFAAEVLNGSAAEQAENVDQVMEAMAEIRDRDHSGLFEFLGRLVDEA